MKKYKNSFDVIPELASNRGMVFNYVDIGTVENVGNDLLSGNVTGAINTTINAITSAIKGRAYTIGKYKLAEKYLDYVTGQSVPDWEHVPDSVVNTAIDYFTHAFGIPITTIEDLDVIDPVYTPGNNVNLYKTTRDPLYAQIPDANVQQAVNVKRNLPYSMNHWDFNSAYSRAGITVNSAGQPTGSSQSGSPASGGTSTVNILLIIGAVFFAIVVILLIIKLAK